MRKIDYFCFSVPKLGDTDYNIAEKDDENTVWLKKTEKALMKQAQENNMLVIYDRLSKNFYKDGKLFDIKEKTIFPKTFIPYEKELLQALESNGAKSLMTLKDRAKIISWPKFFQPQHRKAVFTTYGEFAKNNEKYHEMFEHVFLKTAEKSHRHYFLSSYGSIDIPGMGTIFYTKPPIMNMSDDCEIILSEEYDQIGDELSNCKEYRVFVIDGEILSMSRSYADYSVDIPNEVKEFIKNYVEKIGKTDFSKSYCIDFGQIKIKGKEVIDIIECNPLAPSGQEIDTDLLGNYLKIRENDNNNEND